MVKYGTKEGVGGRGEREREGVWGAEIYVPINGWHRASPEPWVTVRALAEVHIMMHVYREALLRQHEAAANTCAQTHKCAHSVWDKAREFCLSTSPWGKWWDPLSRQGKEAAEQNLNSWALTQNQHHHRWGKATSEGRHFRIQCVFITSLYKQEERCGILLLAWSPLYLKVYIHFLIFVIYCQSMLLDNIDEGNFARYHKIYRWHNFEPVKWWHFIISATGLYLTCAALLKNTVHVALVSDFFHQAGKTTCSWLMFLKNCPNKEGGETHLLPSQHS